MTEYTIPSADNDQLGFSLGFLLTWLFIALLSGFSGSWFIFFSLKIFQYMNRIIRTVSVPLFLWPLAGAVFLGMLVYRREPRAKGEGMPSYLICMREGNGRLSARETFYKYWAAMITLGTIGNGGFLGPLGRVHAGMMSFLYRWFPRKIMSRRMMPLFSICGMSAAFAALIHSPVGAGIFAVEIIQKSDMKYRQLFPAILASTFSVIFCTLFNFEPVFIFKTNNGSVGMHITGILLIVITAAGFAGRWFISLYSKISSWFNRDHHHLSPAGLTLRLLIGSLLAFALTSMINPELSGTSRKIFEALMNGDIEILQGHGSSSIPLWLILAVLLIVKAIANCLTVGSGMSAGFAGPAIIIGLLLGACFAFLFKVPVLSSEYYALLAAGFAGMFSSTMNTPIASAVITLEMFGIHYGWPAGLASIIGFQINRSRTLYDMAMEEREEEL